MKFNWAKVQASTGSDDGNVCRNQWLYAMYSWMDLLYWGSWSGKHVHFLKTNWLKEVEVDQINPNLLQKSIPTHEYTFSGGGGDTMHTIRTLYCS